MSEPIQPKPQSSVRSPLKAIHYCGEEAYVELFYPQLDNAIKHIVVGLSDVRAADDIRVSYDFERDGWKIEQASIFEWSVDDQVCDPDWQEVAFVKAWAREKTPQESAA